MDAATEGAKQGYFQLLKGDLLSYPIESMECLFKGQSAPGDELLIHIWNKTEMPCYLFGTIEKQDNIIWEGCVKLIDFADSTL